MRNLGYTVIHNLWWLFGTSSIIVSGLLTGEGESGRHGDEERVWRRVADVYRKGSGAKGMEDAKGCREEGVEVLKPDNILFEVHKI